MAELTTNSKKIDVHTHREEIKKRTGADKIEITNQIGGLRVRMWRNKMFRQLTLTNDEVERRNVISIVKRIINLLG